MNNKRDGVIKRTIHFFLENIQCTYCHEYQNINTLGLNKGSENEILNERRLSSWSLYLKEFDNYSALILYHSVYKKDIIEVVKNNSFDLILYDVNNKNKFITLEFVSRNEEEGTSIWVPCESDYQLYERIIEKEKKYDEDMSAYIIGTYNIEVKI